MEIIKNNASLRQTVKSLKAQNQSVGFVPTMGNLHNGHLQLVKKAKATCDVVIVSIFVNPMQFGANEDLDNYPRTYDEDCNKLIAEKTDILFFPDHLDMYPNGIDDHTTVNIEHLSNILCGKSRPVHFTGVCTVVTKLFNLVQPDYAFFGEKDYQQLTIIKRMTSDLCMPINIVNVPTERESNGLAMSSRNGYLNKEQQETASIIFSALCNAKKEILEGALNYKELCDKAIIKIENEGLTIDYFEIREQDTLNTLLDSNEYLDIVILAAAYYGKTRLIDNITFSKTSS